MSASSVARRANGSRLPVATEVHFVVPEGVDDPARPSGGNVYDRHVSRGLAELGWTVYEHAVPAGDAALARCVREIPDGAVLLLDGLVASAAPAALVPEAGRVRQVVLVHMPFGDAAAGAVRERERAVLRAATAVVATSDWARRRLEALYGLERVHVATPGVEAAPLAPGRAAGGVLLCVAAVIPPKGHDVLVEALAAIADLPWRCTCVGSLRRDPAFAGSVQEGAPRERVRFLGPLTGGALAAAYAEADLLVHPSRAETYGMVLAEALARGLPVLAAAVGGVPEALGSAHDGVPPGLLVPPGDPAALAAALRRWLGDAGLRVRLRRAAQQRRATLGSWPATAAVLSGVLAGAAR